MAWKLECDKFFLNKYKLGGCFKNLVFEGNRFPDLTEALTNLGFDGARFTDLTKGLKNLAYCHTLVKVKVEVWSKKVIGLNLVGV